MKSIESLRGKSGIATLQTKYLITTVALLVTFFAETHIPTLLCIPKERDAFSEHCCQKFSFYFKRYKFRG